jgi:hypothetical protein
MRYLFSFNDVAAADSTLTFTRQYIIALGFAWSSVLQTLPAELKETTASLSRLTESNTGTVPTCLNVYRM